MDEYIWLGGMPVAVVKTRLTVAFARSTSTNCARNDEYDACGTLYPVSDYLPKVVAMLDSAGKLAGVGDYDVFGRVNQVAVRKDVPSRTVPAGSWMPFGTYWQGYSNYLLASLKQPWRTSSQRVKMRVNYAQVNTPGTVASASDRTWVEAGGAQVAPVWTGFPAYYYYAGPMMAVTTNWFDVPSSGQVDVKWTSGTTVPGAQYSGATVRSYEYRRYEAGASPTWLPLRFPGQYADAETGLFENWNRFYDPSTGSYSATDPLLLTGTAVPLSAYSYADNRPVTLFDATGLATEDEAAAEQDAAEQQAADEELAARRCKNGETVYCHAWAKGESPVEGKGTRTNRRTRTRTGAAQGEFTPDGAMVRAPAGTLGPPPAPRPSQPAPSVLIQPPPLRLIHPESSMSRSTLEYWRKQPTESILRSLLPGQVEPLTVRNDGAVFQGNTRVFILKERGVNVDLLPRTPKL